MNLTMKMKTLGRVIIIDDFLQRDEIERLDNYLTMFKHWEMIYDKPGEERNSWSLGKLYTPPEFGATEYMLIEMFKERLPSMNIPKFHRVLYNCFRYGDSAQLHIDGNSEDAVSFMVYGNKMWDFSWGGETVFIEDEEIGAAVIPKPGRLVIFPGSMIHGGRAPNKFHQGVGRFSIVFQNHPEIDRQ